MKETTSHKIPYPEPTDPNTLAAYYEGIAEKVDEELDDIAPSQITSAGAGDEGKLLIVQNTGAPAFKALSGDVTISEAGVAEIGAGKVGTAELADLGVSTGKINNGAVTEGKTADGAITSRKAKLTAGVIAATENLTLTTSYQDVPGASLNITPAVASILKVTAVFDFSMERSSASPTYLNNAALGTVRLDSVDQTRVARHEVQVDLGQIDGFYQGRLADAVSQVYALPLTAAAHVIKLRAKKSTNEGDTTLALKTQTAFLYELTAA